MTYLSPVNGGRINATIGGNTAGAGSLVSTGTLTLAGGNNITLSQNGNAITISGGAGGVGSQTLGISNLGNSAGASGVISGSALQFVLAGGNNVTLSQSINASSATIIISAFNQSAQTQSNVQAFYDGANSISTGTIRLSNANGVSFGINGQTLTASHNAITLQSNQSVGLYALGNTTQNSSTTLDARTLSFNGIGGITVGYSNGSIQLSGAQTAAQTNQTVGLYALGNTTQNSSTTLDARTLSFNGLGAATVGYSNGSIQISAPTQTVQTQNRFNLTLAGNTTGTLAQVSSGTLTLAGGNNITLSQNGNAVTISAGNGGAGGGIALANSQTTFTSGTANIIEGGGAITIASTTGQSFNISVPQTSSLSATGAVSISTNGSTISIGAPSITTLSRYEYMEGLFTSLNTVGQGSLSINHMYVPFFVTGTAMKIGGSLSASTNTSATTASANISLWMGIYTLNGSTLSLASSGSANNGFQWSQSASSTGNTSVNSMRQMTVPMNVNMTPGEYWVAAVISSATTYTGAAFTLYGNNQVASAAANAVLSPIGSNTTAARDVMLLQGIYTAATSAGPTTIAGSQINNTSASNVQRANFYNVIFNATY